MSVLELEDAASLLWESGNQHCALDDAIGKLFEELSCVWPEGNNKPDLPKTSLFAHVTNMCCMNAVQNPTNQSLNHCTNLLLNCMQQPQ